MTTKNHLIEQHFLEHEARQKHVDELLAQARNKATGTETSRSIQEEIDELEKEREAITERINALREHPMDHWQEESIEEAGPMGIWDALAQQIEGFLERHGK